MRKVLTLLLSLQLFGCASAGIVENSEFVEPQYLLKNPDKYSNKYVKINAYLKYFYEDRNFIYYLTFKGNNDERVGGGDFCKSLSRKILVVSIPRDSKNKPLDISGDDGVFVNLYTISGIFKKEERYFTGTGGLEISWNSTIDNVTNIEKQNKVCQMI